MRARAREGKWWARPIGANFEQWELTTAAIDGLVAAARDAQEAMVAQWRAQLRLLTTG